MDAAMDVGKEFKTDSAKDPIECDDVLTKRQLVDMKREAKKQAEEEQMTFKPKLMARSSSRSRRPSSPFNASLTPPSIDAKKTHVDENLTFQPKLIARSTSRGKRPPSPSPQHFSERLYSTKNPSNSTVEEPSFRPAITERASSMTRSPGKSISDKLYSEAQKIKERIADKKVEVEKEAFQDCTFAPKMVTTSVPKRLGDTAEERFLKYEEIKKAKIQKAKEDLLLRESSEATFKPNIIRHATPTRQGNVYNRLSSSIEKKNLKAVEDEMNVNNTFQPRITKPSSKQIVSFTFT